MAATPVNQEKNFRAGLQVSGPVKKLVIPINAGTPSGAAQGWVWVDTTGAPVLAYHDGTSAIFVGAALTTEQIQDIVGPFVSDSADLDFTYDDAGNAVAAVFKASSVDYANIIDQAQATFLMRAAGAGTGPPIAGTPTQAKAALAVVAADISDFVANARSSISITDTATLDLTYAAGVLSGVVLDSPTVAGQTPAALQSTIVNAIVNGAGAAYDTLVEIKAFLQADDTSISGLLTSVAARARFYAGAVPTGATTAAINHNLGLANIHDYTIKTFVTATGVVEEYAHVGADGNNITLTDETGTNFAAGRRAFVTAGV